MKSILLRSVLVALVAMAASSIAVSIGIRMFGEKPMPSAFWLSKIVPLIVSFPISLCIFRQGHHIAKLNSELSASYDTLATLHAQLISSSRMDGMTQLFNRDAFFKIVDGLPPSGIMLLIDADHFKLINDRYGHAAGDTALVAIAHAIRGQLRPADIVGRLGGEEFGVYLHETCRTEADAIAERIRWAVHSIDFRPTGDAAHRLSVSIGGAKAARDLGLQSVLKVADSLLYKAKSQGRNCVVLEAA